MNTNIEIEDLKALMHDILISQKETREMFKETDLKFKETDLKFKETDNQIKQTDKQIKAAINLFESQWGKLMESLVEGDLINILKKQGIEVHYTATRTKGTHGSDQFELDIIAHNGTEIVVVEVKTTLRVAHVNEFLDELPKIKTWLPQYKNSKIYGAIAFLRAEEQSEIYAQKNKLFVIKATGNSASIVNEPGFAPRAY